MIGIVGKPSPLSEGKKRIFGERSPLEREIVENLRNAPNNSLRYSEIWKGHKSDAVKNLLLKLENEGWIRITPEREAENIKFVATVQLIKDVFVDKYAEEIIKKFNETNSIESKKIVMGNNLLDIVSHFPTNSVKIVNFVCKVMIENEDNDLITFCAQCLDYIYRIANDKQIKPILNEFQKLKKNKILIEKLENVSEDDTKTRNCRYICSRIFVLLEPKRSLESLLNTLKRSPTFVHPDGYADLIIDAYKNSKYDRQQIIEKCEEILKKDYDDEKKQIVKIIIQAVYTFV